MVADESGNKEEKRLDTSRDQSEPENRVNGTRSVQKTDYNSSSRRNKLTEDIRKPGWRIEMEPCAAMRPAFLKGDEGTLLTSHEAEYIVEHLSCLGIDQRATSSTKPAGQISNLWLNLALLLQAHYNTMALCDEFVMAVSDILVYTTSDHSQIASCRYQEAVQYVKVSQWKFRDYIGKKSVVQQVALFHSEACEALGSDALLELADYTYRKVVYLNTKAWEDASAKERTASEMVNLKPEEEVEDKVARNRFCAGVCALSVLRYLTDYISSLSPCVMARLLDCHDVVMALIPLVESAPWTRKRKSGDKRWVEKYSKGKWSEVPPADRYLLVEPDVQGVSVSYVRVFTITLKTEMQKTLEDNSGVLEELQLKILNTDPDRGGLILEQVPALRESMLRRDDWREMNHLNLLVSDDYVHGLESLHKS
ncbi:hypothetical protein AXG93_2402s1230 [Marchantia polymorpha subsp. ruderalis]|uniref:Uncharacterized protein n=1 Tax=Marchantia polymorpha subsp. ruderalis TaxID=1480154 RepID=A0A176VTC8_MARPO|nr:hypothetical protein AXG93_2402s1230 [Marchantia polymorpha subsp. ruderalis]